MTPGYICEGPIEEIHVGPDLRPLPCTVCLSAVAECVSEYDEDKRSDLWEKTQGESLEEFLSNKRKYDV